MDPMQHLRQRWKTKMCTSIIANKRIYQDVFGAYIVGNLAINFAGLGQHTRVIAFFESGEHMIMKRMDKPGPCVRFHARLVSH